MLAWPWLPTRSGIGLASESQRSAWAVTVAATLTESVAANSDTPFSFCHGGFGVFCLRGQWPRLKTWQGQSHAVNGGVPQNASLQAHLDEIRRTMPFGVAENYTGIVAIDFEAWAPIWSEDTSKDGWHSAAYQNLSIELVLQKEPNLPLAEAKAKAKKAFESAALEFFVETIKLCRTLRPNARWGYCTTVIPSRFVALQYR